jgi:hypothetical protein
MHESMVKGYDYLLWIDKSSFHRELSVSSAPYCVHVLTVLGEPVLRNKRYDSTKSTVFKVRDKNVQKIIPQLLMSQQSE